MKLSPNMKQNLWMILLFLLCVLSTCVRAEAGLVKVVADMSVCSNPMFCQNQRSYGSGVVVGDYKGRSIVLTAGHVLQGHDRQGVPCKAQLRSLLVSGTTARVIGSWVDSDPPVDFAILLVDKKFKETVPLGSRPRKGDAVTIYGWDFAVSDKPELVTRSGKITDDTPRQMVQVDFTSGSGISGGPVIDRNGNLSGILVHSTGIMPNYDFRRSILSLLRDANLPPPNPEKYVRKVDDKKAASNQVSAAEKKQAELEAIISQLKKEKEEWQATKKPTETVVSDTGKQSPPTEDTSPKDSSGDSTGSGETIQDSTSKRSIGSRVVTGAKKTLDAAEVGLSFADSLLSNPLVMVALGATGMGASLAGVKAGVSLSSSALAWMRRRKKTVVEEEKKRPEPPLAKVVPKQSAGADKDCSLNVADIAEHLKGLVVTQELQADGKTTEEQLWRDGVRLAKEGALQLNVLGGKQVAQAIEEHVYREKSRQDGVEL